MKAMQPIKLKLPPSLSRKLQAVETEIRQIMQKSKKHNTNCKIGKIYCKPGTICKPIEGSFCTECELCNKFN